MIAQGIDVEKILETYGGWGFFGVTVWIGGRALLGVLRDGFTLVSTRLGEVGQKVDEVGHKVDELRACVTKQGDRLERLEDQFEQRIAHRKAQ